MDFHEYVGARRASLVRAAVLLGSPEGVAPGVVDATLASAASRIRGADDPDPEVYRRLLPALAGHRGTADWVEPAQIDPRDHAGFAVRRALAALSPEARDVAVLRWLAGLDGRATREALRIPAAALAEGSAAALAGLAVAAGPHRELDASEALNAAAQTIEVAPGPPIRPVGRRNTRIVVGLAALTLVLAGTAAVALRGSQSPAPGPAPVPPAPDRLSSEQVPSLFGYDAAHARRLLEKSGLTVFEELAQRCEVAGRVVATDPGVGEPLSPGERITVSLAQPSDPRCMDGYSERAAAWRFIDFANGRGPAPRFARTVYVVYNGSPPSAVTGRNAGLPAGIPALDEIRALSGRVLRTSTGYATPTLQVATRTPAPETCGIARPPAAGERQVLSLTLALGPDDSSRCPLMVDLYRNAAGVIDAVAVYSEKAGPTVSPTAVSPPPWVTGSRGR